ncbi:MAG: hypothetical protein GF383_04965 [Candidatus Lokiarchaeota archaeon]|nr:hypothetical protein [Candidatus Lokiarchaeota archaeon]MBD3339220.1 hypothetical protein [Candidatus Lokiarchaeota archaeon]
MIVDSTILISLDNLGKIELINNCLIPDKVLNEITNEPAKSAGLTLKFQKVIPSEKSIKQSLKILGDTNETRDSDIVALLIDSSSSIIATDDKGLRNVCRALGGKVTGTLGILINSVKNTISLKRKH